MIGLIVLVSVVLLVVLVAWGLALHWANTPHGRLKPIFAFAFKIAPLVNQAEAGDELGTKQMATPEARARSRADFQKNVGMLAKPVPFAGRIEDRSVPGPAGEIPVRVYVPPGEGPHPVVVYAHGGGWVTGTIEYTDGVTRSIAARTPAVVISVEYRLAPEHVFPAALDDVVAVVDWAAEHATEYGGRAGPVTVAGDSAGGNLSALTALRDRDSGAGNVALQVLIYPCVDATNSNRGSYLAFESGYGLSREAVDDCVALYVPDRAQRVDASPLLAPSLAGLARAFVITGGFDVLRDEGIEYAKCLEKEGVPVRHLHLPDLPHGFIQMNRLCREAEETIGEIAMEIRSVSGG